MTLSLMLAGEEVNSYRAWTNWALQQEVGRGFFCSLKAFPHCILSGS